MQGAAILTAFAVVVTGALTTVAQKGPAPAQWPGYLGGGVTLLPNGWKIAPEGRHVQVGDLPMAIVPSPGGRFAAVSTSGYDKPALSIFDTRSLQVIARLPVEHTWLGLVWHPDGRRLFASGSSENAIYEFEWANGKLNPAATITLGTPANGRFPTEPGKSHYYAARETEATSLRVGSQSEKFLFYRGVANFDIALSARPSKNGDIEVTNLGSETIPNVVLFERHGSTFGYRVGGSLSRSVTLAEPQQNATLESLRSDLERMLIGAGLYPREAAAMLETWRDSWFEDGTRVFYIVPPKAVDAILPLTVNPVPASIARVFVGRMEVLTPNVQQTVESAIARNDAATLERYARFLGPISDRILAKPSTSGATASAVRSATSAAYASYVRRSSTVCE